MRIFEFRSIGPMPVEAFVLAANQDDATELFEEYALAHGGDPDSLLWREWPVRRLGDAAEHSAVRQAAVLDREGLVVCQSESRWVFVIPLGAGVEAIRRGA